MFLRDRILLVLLVQYEATVKPSVAGLHSSDIVIATVLEPLYCVNKKPRDMMSRVLLAGLCREISRRSWINKDSTR